MVSGRTMGWETSPHKADVGVRGFGVTLAEAFAEVFPGVHLPLLYDVSHYTCKEEMHAVAGRKQKLFVHRKGAMRACGSACHGAGRAMCHEASKRWHGRALVDELAARGFLIRSLSLRGVAEEAPLTYKEVGAVVDASEQAGLAGKVARLLPLVCVKG